MWGIIPAAGVGSRIQPLAFSKELLPVGSRFDGDVEQPRAVSEYLVERMILGGATKVCFVISPGKSDILEYYGASIGPASLTYVVQSSASGLCDAIFCALPLISRDEPVLIGLPDTIWFPEDGFTMLRDDALSFLLFPVQHPEFFEAVETDGDGRVQRIWVKQFDTPSRWIWGAMKMPGAVLHDLHQLWCERDRLDEYLGTLINAGAKHGASEPETHTSMSARSTATAKPFGCWRHGMAASDACADPVPSATRNSCRPQHPCATQSAGKRRHGDFWRAAFAREHSTTRRRAR